MVYESTMHFVIECSNLEDRVCGNNSHKHQNWNEDDYSVTFSVHTYRNSHNLDVVCREKWPKQVQDPNSHIPALSVTKLCRLFTDTALHRLPGRIRISIRIWASLNFIELLRGYPRKDDVKEGDRNPDEFSRIFGRHFFVLVFTLGFFRIGIG